MKILGLHFGHDAGVALIEDGSVKIHAHSERLLRQKKAGGISYGMLVDVLDRAEIRPEQIDFCAITSTQGIDIAFDSRMPFYIELVRHSRDTIRAPLEALVAQAKAAGIAVEQVLDPTQHLPVAAARKRKRLQPFIEQMGIPEPNVRIVNALNRNLLDPSTPISRQRGLSDLSRDLPNGLSFYEPFKFELHYPVTLVMDGQRIPAAFVNHHAAHAAATFYQSPFQTSAIMTLDGGGGFTEGGLFWIGTHNQITPIRQHYIELGHLYLYVAHEILKLGGSAEGKMMGLSPYGAPNFFDRRFIANAVDKVSGNDLAVVWWNHIQQTIAASTNYTREDLASSDKMTSSVNTEIAASTQLLFEETMLAAMEQLEKILANIGVATDNLALSGGCMLNCPTNTRISQESRFKNVYVEPACDDGGLPAGGALWVYHNLMGHPRTLTDPVKAGVPYLGLAPDPADINSALEEFADRIVVSEPASAAEEGAKRLTEGQVLGWFEGRSEIGPRALGHRSIVADPRGEKTWHRVNTIKGRELWRPLAPSVLAEHANEWFSGMPESSPFMMFVGKVTRPDVPAITHVDGTARVQTVTKECGGYYDLIKAFHKLTGCAVVLNTSMNGPGQPIAEYPADAIEMLLDGRFDVLFLEGRLIQRRADA